MSPRISLTQVPKVHEETMLQHNSRLICQVFKWKMYIAVDLQLPTSLGYIQVGSYFNMVLDHQIT